MLPVILLSLAGLGIVGAIFVSLCREVYHVPRQPDEVIEVETPDGHHLGLTRYHARGPRRALAPAILCHGVSANRYNMDFDDDVSLALYLARAGFEVFVLELRGRGRSRHSRSGKVNVPRHGIDTYIVQDVPTAIQAVCKKTGAKRVHWVGHSMGGLVLYGHLACTPNAPVASGVTIGTPLRLQVPWWLRGGLRIAHALPFGVPVLWSHLAFLAAPFAGAWPWFPLSFIVEPANTSPQRRQTALRNLVSDLAGGEVKDFARLSVTKKFQSKSGFDYETALQKVMTPMLAIAGDRDQIATPAAVRVGVNALGGTDNSYRIAGKESGAPTSFGHGDLLIGDHAPAIVFSTVADWLRNHDPAPPSPATEIAPSRSPVLVSGTKP